MHWGLGGGRGAPSLHRNGYFSPALPGLKVHLSVVRPKHVTFVFVLLVTYVASAP